VLQEWSDARDGVMNGDVLMKGAVASKGWCGEGDGVVKGMVW
jgi:hypothetical protein